MAVPAQDAITPSSVEKIKRGLPTTMLFGLNTTPVGADGGAPPAAGGIVTIKGPGVTGCGVPLPLYKGEAPVPLSATHHGLVADLVSPHGLTRLASVTGARPGRSETRLLTI